MMKAERFLLCALFICFILFVICTYKSIVEWEDSKPRATVSPRFPMDVTETWDDFDNGEETTIHLEEK